MSYEITGPSEGSRFRISSVCPDPRRLRVGFDWDTTGHLNFDVCAFAVDDTMTIVSDRHFVYFNNPALEDESICLTGDEAGGPNDAQIVIDLGRIDPGVNQILLCVSSWSPRENEADFGTTRFRLQLSDDVSGEAILIYQPAAHFGGMGALDLGALHRSGNSWEFEALDRARRGGLRSLVNAYTERGYFVRPDGGEQFAPQSAVTRPVQPKAVRTGNE